MAGEHRITFFPLGNADCSELVLSGGKRFLFDYANTRCADDPNDKRIDLPATLRARLKTAGRSSYDVVAFTHFDNDHICGAPDFFELKHAAKYQGGDRISMDAMWVPAHAITDDECSGDAKLLQTEARYRLKAGSGIRVFSRPAALEKWLNKEGLSLDSRRSLITDAGQLVPGFTISADEVEFFVHSPFASRQNDGTFIERNDNSIVFQATLSSGGVISRLLLAADSTHEVLSEIVRITKAKGRAERLRWDVCKLPHHCSYLALGPDKGTNKTEPVPDVKWLFEDSAEKGGITISTSKPIPGDDSDDQPPHRQAGNYHRDTTTERNGQFKVTMEYPTSSAPEPLTIRIDARKASIEMRGGSPGAAALGVAAPRVG